MSIIIVGIDLAKNAFAVHGVDDNGKSVLVKPKVSRYYDYLDVRRYWPHFGSECPLWRKLLNGRLWPH